ncbi:hypothetical protein DQ04_03171060 [Trypanosoma grayi]|uniref:hypothetical protein n=1 Tax=Trypanosoma grayi TaxID=71804 RepID=UPI0004F44794|nr:hypothetical protein DQ04_03171060 [Trypanosoma grayi]KEG10902.1 hypothetical protein DQ04_03171060 [Trypanosoma grayi]
MAVAPCSTSDIMLSNHRSATVNTPYVCLKGCGITRLDTLLSSFAQLRHMLSLDLSDNYISCLPFGDDLAACMPQLRSLDLSGNPLKLCHEVIESLRHLRELHSLRLSLPDAGAVLWLSQSLPQLRVINGVEVVSSSGSGEIGAAEAVDFSPVVPPAGFSERLLGNWDVEGTPLNIYCRLRRSIRTLRWMHDASSDEAEADKEKVYAAFNAMQAAQHVSSIVPTAPAPHKAEQQLFKHLFLEAVKTTEMATCAGSNDPQRLKGLLGTTAHVMQELYGCYTRLAPPLGMPENQNQKTKFQKQLRNVTTMPETESGFINMKQQRLSLLSLLSLVQKMVRRKQCRETELRRGIPWNGCCYYETMQRHMFFFFAEQYPRATEVEISAHITEFTDTLHYYANVEKCVEAYVFAQVLDNKIEESYWSVFESLCTTISDVIKRVALPDFAERDVDRARDTQLGKYDRYEWQEMWLRHCAHHGFLSKEHVFCIIDTLIPETHRNTTLHIDLVETAASLIAATGKDNGKDGYQGPIVSVGCLLCSLSRVFVKHHEHSIYPIVQAFHTVSDMESAGIVTVGQLRDLLQLLDSPVAVTPNLFEQMQSAASGTLSDAPLTFSAVVEATRRLVRGHSLSV